MLNISVKSKGEDTHWHFSINKPQKSGEVFSAHGIRHTENVNFDIFKVENEFSSLKSVVGLENYDLACTLIYPTFRNSGNYRMNDRIGGYKKEVTGSFQHYISGFAIEDLDEAIFESIKFSSKHVANFFSMETINTNFNPKKITIEAASEEITEFGIENLGIIKFYVLARHGNQNSEINLKQLTYVEIIFHEKQSTLKVMELCFELEWFFAFLIGFNGGFSEYVLTSTIDNKKIQGTLNFGGFKYREESFPNSEKAILNYKDIEDCFSQTLNNYLKHSEEILTFIQAVELSRSKYGNLSNIFSFVMPAFEYTIKQKFNTDEDKEILKAKEKFLRYINSSEDEEIKNFCTKAVNIKLRKKGLKQWIGGAIEYLNSKDFKFTLEMAQKITDRRNDQFHEVEQIKDFDAFYKEIEFITIALMLLTYEDIGINLETISQKRHIVWDLRNYCNS